MASSFSIARATFCSALSALLLASSILRVSLASLVFCSFVFFFRFAILLSRSRFLVFQIGGLSVKCNWMRWP